MRLLIIEDSERLRRSLSTGLRRAGYAVDAAADGEEGLWHARTNDYDVIILDLLLPEVDGLTLLKRLRGEGRQTHVIIISARDSVEDRILGLRSGADDYMVKPFSFDELLARIEALVRRRHGSKSPCITIGPIEVDITAHTVRRSGEPVLFPPREQAILEYLAVRRGQVVTRTEIEAHIYDHCAEPMSNVIDSSICAIRRRLDTPGEPSLVTTRRGMGYVLGADPS